MAPCASSTSTSSSMLGGRSAGYSCAPPPPPRILRLSSPAAEGRADGRRLQSPATRVGCNLDVGAPAGRGEVAQPVLPEPDANEGRDRPLRLQQRHHLRPLRVGRVNMLRQLQHGLGGRPAGVRCGSPAPGDASRGRPDQWLGVTCPASSSAETPAATPALSVSGQGRRKSARHADLHEQYRRRKKAAAARRRACQSQR